jgi:hypothetical protein
VLLFPCGSQIWNLHLLKFKASSGYLLNFELYGSLQYLCLQELQRQSYTHYFYEATVGAGLPIINILQGLNETKDKIMKIEGIFRYLQPHNCINEYDFYTLNCSYK